MEQEIAYEVTLEFKKKAIRKFIFRHAGTALFGFAVIFLIGILALLFGQLKGMLWFSVLFPIVVFGQWFRYYLKCLEFFSKHKDRKVILRIIPESISFETSDASSSVKWTLIKKLWVYPDMLFLFIEDDMNYVTIPTAGFSEGIKESITTKVKENGGKVE